MLLFYTVNIKKKATSKVFDKDDEGIKYKFPDRSCKKCLNYPCFKGMEVLSSDMAKYGCKHYQE